MPADVVAIKVNPFGYPNFYSRPATVAEIIRGLNLAGVPNDNIVIYDRYTDYLAQVGYETFDGSDHHAAGCVGCNPNLCTTAIDTRVPLVHVTIDNTTNIYRDTGLLLSTGGVDRAGCPNTGTRNDESEQWQQINT